MPHNPRHVEQLMNAARAGQGRGDQYGYQMSQRSPGGAIRGITNAPQIGREGMPGHIIGQNMMPDFAGRGWGRGSNMGYGEIGGKFSGLTMEEDMLLKEQGFLDKGGVRYVLDWDTGKVSQFPAGSSGPVRPTSMAERVGGPGASKPLSRYELLDAGIIEK